jgi:hypothetical protein
LLNKEAFLGEGFFIRKQKFPLFFTTLSDEILKRANRAKKEKENQNIATTILLDA